MEAIGKAVIGLDVCGHQVIVASPRIGTTCVRDCHSLPHPAKQLLQLQLYWQSRLA